MLLYNNNLYSFIVGTIFNNEDLAELSDDFQN